jgi:hypothetical protein
MSSPSKKTSEKLKKRGRHRIHWDDKCMICSTIKFGIDSLCCEGCPHIAHITCVKDIPLPTEDWFCGICKFSPSKALKKKDVDAPPCKPKKLRVLELFKGTGSVTEYCEEYPHKFKPVISIDVEDDAEPSEVCDIRKWNYGKYSQHHFDIIWASPPCTDFSILKTTGTKDMETANEIVKTTIKIIEYFQPKMWFIENPQTGSLKDEVYMKKYHFYDVDYCKYSDFGYRKRTRIWTNLKDGFIPKKCQKDCEYMDGKKHVGTFGSTYTPSKAQKYRVPKSLLHELFWPLTERF